MHNKPHSEETKRRLSEKIKQSYLSGRVHPRLGKKHTEKTKTKISLNRKGKCVGVDNPFFGKKHSEESLQKMSNANIGKYLINPDLTPNIILCYILGVLKGDGSVYNHRNGINVTLTVIDKIFAESFCNALKLINLNPNIYKEREKYYAVEASSKKFGLWYKDLTLKNIENLLDTNDKICSFIRGFYESEGNSYKNSIHIYNTNEELINMVRRLLERLGFIFHIYKRENTEKYTNGCCFTLHKNKKSETIRFFEIIKPCIKNPLLKYSL